MNYLTNYYKNLSEQLQARVNHLQKLIEAKNEISANKFSIIDKISGDVRSPSGEGAQYLVRGNDGYHYAVDAPHNAQWAWDNEAPDDRPKTWELIKGKHDFSVARQLDPNDKYDAKLMKQYGLDNDDIGEPREIDHEEARVMRNLLKPGQ